MMKHYPFIGDVRGKGLFLGIEFVKDPELKNPYTDLAQNVLEGLKGKLILAGTDGPDNNVLILKPPLCFSRDNADQFLQVFTEIMVQAPSHQ